MVSSPLLRTDYPKKVRCKTEICISLNLKTNVFCQSSLTLRTSLLERDFSVDKNSNVTDLIDLTDLILIILI